jgi:hypothetical protein
MSTEYNEWLMDHRQSLMKLSDLIGALRKDDVSIEQLGDIVAQFNQFKADISLLYNELLSVMGQRMGDADMVILESGATIERKFSKDRKGWQHKDLAAAVADRIDQMSIDMNTGERLLSAREVAEKMLDFVQPSYWRVGALDKIGISADEFCESGETKESIVLRKPKGDK